MINTNNPGPCELETSFPKGISIKSTPHLVLTYTNKGDAPSFELAIRFADPEGTDISGETLYLGTDTAANLLDLIHEEEASIGIEELFGHLEIMGKPEEVFCFILEQALSPHLTLAADVEEDSDNPSFCISLLSHPSEDGEEPNLLVATSLELEDAREFFIFP